MEVKKKQKKYGSFCNKYGSFCNTTVFVIFIVKCDTTNEFIISLERPIYSNEK